MTKDPATAAGERLAVAIADGLSVVVVDEPDISGIR